MPTSQDIKDYARKSMRLPYGLILLTPKGMGTYHEASLAHPGGIFSLNMIGFSQKKINQSAKFNKNHDYEKDEDHFSTCNVSHRPSSYGDFVNAFVVYFKFADVKKEKGIAPQRRQE